MLDILTMNVAKNHIWKRLMLQGQGFCTKSKMQSGNKLDVACLRFTMSIHIKSEEAMIAEYWAGQIFQGQDHCTKVKGTIC